MPYEGHATTSASKAASEGKAAPADRPDYDAADYTDQPGVAAREKGYPRHDGRSTSVGGPR